MLFGTVHMIEEQEEMENREEDQPIQRSLSGQTPPPRRRGGRSKADPAKPQLPRERPHLAAGVYRDIKRTAREQDIEDVATAVAVATEAMSVGDVERAVELLTWASSRAGRSVAIREGLGVALYSLGRFEDAQRELQAYRRLSGRADQNHLLADCARALGRDDRVDGLVREMLEGDRARAVPNDRAVEGVIVQAGMLAGNGDYDGALVLLDRAPLDPETGVEHARTWYLAGDVAEQKGDVGLAQEYFEAVAAIDDEFLDVGERLSRLDS